MNDRSRLYNTVTITMVALSASLCTIVVIIGLSRLTAKPVAAVEPTLMALGSPTGTLAGVAPQDSPTPALRATRTPRPTWTPLPSATLLPGETVEPLDEFEGVPTAEPGEASLDLISTIPTTRDMPEVTLEVDLNFANDWARVEQSVQVRNYSNEAWNEIVFSIPLAALSEFALDSVTAGMPAEPVSASQDGIMLHVPLPRAIPPGLLARVNLSYRVGVPEVSFYSSFPDGNNGYSGGVMRLGEWYPVVAPYRDRQGWESWRYQSTGDPTVYPAANTTLAVRAPSGVTIVSGGFYGREGNVWRFRVEGARGMPIMASERYDMVEGTVNNMAVRVYTLGVNPDAANGAIDIARDAIGIYSDLYGPYPFKSLDIVENGYTGDMEYSGLVSISSRGFVTIDGDPSGLMQVLLAHEIAHQWWYGGVGNDQVNEPWLDESLASYSEALFFEKLYGADPNPRMVSFRSRELRIPIDLAIYQYPTTVQYKEAVYPRGAIFLEELRNVVGDSAFFDFLKDYQAQYRGKLATTEDFFRVLRLHTTADLDPLLQAYFDNPAR